MLDEPTTGLDSSTALALGRDLRTISNFGIPVLCALLQPSLELFSLFNKLILLHEGKVISSKVGNIHIDCILGP